MDHLLITEDLKDLRKQVVSHIHSSYRINRASNLIFVCGGNDENHMRPRFNAYCKKNLPDYELFMPESAMKNIFSAQLSEPFDIADFEELVGELSHAIVIFPEAPGSFAETGYFSAVPKLAKKSILVTDLAHQHSDSFISMGPAKKIAAHSVFQPTIQTNYKDPNFIDITNRINRVKISRNKKRLEIASFKSTDTYDIACIIYCVISILTIATFDDLIFFMRALFSGHISENKIQLVSSILVGADYLVPVGDYGHLRVDRSKVRLAEVLEGRVADLNTLRLTLASSYERGDAEFVGIVEAANAAG